MRADLHIHSTVSDGSKTIHEIIDIATKKGLDFIAVTDHDTMAHAKLLPKSPAIKVIAGIEISAIDKKTGTKAHVLGYNINNFDYVENLTLPLLKKRHENSLRQIEILQNEGMEIDIDKLNKADGKYIYKQHIMKYLVETKQVAEMFGSFYKTVFKSGGICDFDIEYIDVNDAVNVIKSAGGLAVLAHPGQQKNFYLIDKLHFDGIEVNHLANSKGDKKILKEYASKYNLFLTGGSDYHGNYESVPVDIGDFISEESGVNALC